MNKIATDIDQSKKLLEIGIDSSTADMHYSSWTILEDGEFILSPNYGQTIEEMQKEYGDQIIPAWSLSALLSVLPNKLQIALAINDFQGDRKEKYAIGSVEHDRYDCFADNPIDACYEMIIKLHEQKLL